VNDCQVSDPYGADLECPVTESGGYRCEVRGEHDSHAISDHTIAHAIAGNDWPCSAIGGRRTP
jgi:hypothetical protein